MDSLSVNIKKLVNPKILLRSFVATGILTAVLYQADLVYTFAREGVYCVKPYAYPVSGLDTQATVELRRNGGFNTVWRYLVTPDPNPVRFGQGDTSGLSRTLSLRQELDGSTTSVNRLYDIPTGTVVELSGLNRVCKQVE